MLAFRRNSNRLFWLKAPVVAAVLICLIGGLYWLFRSPPGEQPSFAAQPIGFYLKQMRDSKGELDNTEKWRLIQDATNALHHFGPDGIQWLADRLERPQPQPQTPNLLATVKSFSQKAFRKLKSLMGGEPMSSQHEGLLDREILSALINSGHLAVPVLTNYLDMSKYDGHVRQEIYRALTYLPLSVHAAPAIPVLEVNARSSNSMDRVVAANAIGWIDRTRRKEMVGILIAELKDTKSMNRISAVNSLKNFEELASPAVPVLETLWRGPNSQLQREARLALQRIMKRQYPLRPSNE